MIAFISLSINGFPKTPLFGVVADVYFVRFAGTLNGTELLRMLLIPHVPAVTCQNVSHEKVYCSYNYEMGMKHSVLQIGSAGY